MLGGCVGTLSHQLFPELVPSVAPYVVVGMGAFFAGVANAPIASLLMVCELTGAYDRRAIVSNGATLAEMEAFASRAGISDPILQNADGELAGLVALDEVIGRDEVEHLDGFVLAHDLVNRRQVYLRPEDNLISALEFFGDPDFDKLPIVEERDHQKLLLGHVQYRDILNFYRREHGRETPAAATSSPAPSP